MTPVLTMLKHAIADVEKGERDFAELRLENERLIKTSESLRERIAHLENELIKRTGAP